MALWSASCSTLLGLILANLLGGITNSYGFIVVYVASYLHIHQEDANLSTLTMMFPIEGVGWSGGLILGAWIYTKCGGKVTIAIGAIVIAGVSTACSFITEMYVFGCLFLAFCIGFGPCLLVINSLYVIWAWFPQRKGLMTGILMLSYGAGTSLWGLLITFLVNPENRSPDHRVTVGSQEEYLFSEDIASRFPMVLRIAAIVAFFVGVVSFFLIKNKETSCEDRKSVIKSSVSRPSPADSGVCPNLRSAVRTSAFWMLFLYSYCAYDYNLFLLVQYKNYAMTVTKNDQLLSGFGSIAFFWNTVTRFLISLLMDYASFKKVSLTVMATQTVIAGTLPLVVALPYVYLVWVSISFACYAAIFSPVTLVTGEIFGPKVGAMVYSLISQGSILAEISMAPIVQWVVKPYGYPMAFYLLAGVSAVGVMLIVLLRTKYEWGQEKLMENEEQE